MIYTTNVTHVRLHSYVDKITMGISTMDRKVVTGNFAVMEVAKKESKSR